MFDQVIKKGQNDCFHAAGKNKPSLSVLSLHIIGQEDSGVEQTNTKRISRLYEVHRPEYNRSQVIK